MTTGRVPDDIRARFESMSGPDVGRGGGPGERVFSQVLFPPYVYPPPGASFFFGGDDAAIGVGPVTTKFTGAQAAPRIPQGNIGVVRELSFYVNNLLTTSQITFTVLINGNSAEGYSAVRIPQVAAAVFAYSPDNVFIPVPEGGVIEVRATVTDVATYSLSFTTRGWSYSKEIAQRWAGVA